MNTFVHIFSNILVILFLKLNGIDSSFLIFSNLIDIDHFWAKPIYDPNRSSFVHMLHKYYIPIIIFGFIINTYFGVGLVMHFILDKADYLLKKK